MGVAAIFGPFKEMNKTVAIFRGDLTLWWSHFKGNTFWFRDL